MQEAWDSAHTVAISTAIGSTGGLMMGFSLSVNAGLMETSLARPLILKYTGIGCKPDQARLGQDKTTHLTEHTIRCLWAVAQDT